MDPLTIPIVAIMVGGALGLSKIYLDLRKAMLHGAGSEELHKFRQELAALRHDIAALRESHADLTLMLHDADRPPLPKPDADS